MTKSHTKCVVDTNVAVVANLAAKQGPAAGVPLECVLACVNRIDTIVKKGGLVMDKTGEIFNEYKNNLALRGQPGVGDAFAKWVHDHQWNSSKVDLVPITKNGTSYDEFPNHAGLAKFDNDDRKFVAVANAHPEKPPVLQATDSKWWGCRGALTAAGITVQFLCPDYVQTTYDRKMGV